MRNLLRLRRGCSSVVERALSMREAPGSITGISIIYFCNLVSTHNSLVKRKVTTTDCKDFREGHHSKDEKYTKC